MMFYSLYRIGHFVAISFPLKVTYAFASAVAWAYCHIRKKDRDAVAFNMRTVLGSGADEEAIRRMSKDVFTNFAKYLVDFFRFSKVDRDYIDKFVRVEGRHNIEAALEIGKGTILLSAHIGNWELGGIAVALLGYPMNAVVLPHRNKKVNEFFTHQRMLGKMRPIEVGMSLRECFRAFKDNEFLALLGDRDFSRHGIYIDFFGKNALIPKGPAVFSHRCGATIVPTFMIRNPDDTFTLFFDAPIVPEPAEHEAEAVERITKKCTAAIEKYVKLYPDQWYIFKPFWENGKEER